MSYQYARALSKAITGTELDNSMKPVLNDSGSLVLRSLRRALRLVKGYGLIDFFNVLKCQESI